MITPQNIVEIRKSILPEKVFIKKGRVLPISNQQRTNTNCFAYALGITYPAKGNEWYQPGFTQNTRYNPYSREDFLNKVEIDLTNLGFRFRKIVRDEKTKLRYDEYLIQVLFSPAISGIDDGDFHFMRRSSSGKWFHKRGWGYAPEIFTLPLDTSKMGDAKIKKMIENNEVASFGFQNEFGIETLPLCYYAITFHP